MPDAHSQEGEFSAKLGSRVSSGPPTPAPVARVRDVIVCATDNATVASSEEFRAHPPVGTPATLRLTNAVDRG
jgi:hypothetical protein